MIVARLLVAFSLALMVGACASASERYQTTTLVETEKGTIISRDASFVVAVAGDGKYIDKPYPESGGRTRSAMVDALSKYAGNVTEALSFVPEGATGAGALGREADYLVYLKIHHWEERATEWSGKPDQIEVEIRLYDGRKGPLLASRIVKAGSSWATLGGDHPQDLLIKPFNDYAAGIFGVPVAGTS